MALPYNHQKLVLYGTLQTTQTWSIGLGIIGMDVEGATFTRISNWLTAMDTALGIWWNNGGVGVGMMNPGSTKFLGAKVYDYTAGNSVANIVVDHVFSTPKSGTSAANYLPTQTALVASLLSGQAGRHNRGRSYLPCGATAMSTGPKISTSVVDAVCQAHRDLLHNIEIIGYGSSTTLGAVILRNASTPVDIQSVKVDNEPDVQRRRADKVLADYSKLIAV